MKINGKEYKINTDITFGIMEDSQKDPNNPDTMKRMLKEILIPKPTEKAIRGFKLSQITKIMEEFSAIQKQEQTTFKKKLSLL